MSAHGYKLDSCRLCHELNLKDNGFDERFGGIHLRSIVLPINGPNAVTNSPLPIICQPKAAGSCSNEQYSDTHNVKLLKAIPKFTNKTQSSL